MEGFYGLDSPEDGPPMTAQDQPDTPAGDGLDDWRANVGLELMHPNMQDDQKVAIGGAVLSLADLAALLDELAALRQQASEVEALRDKLCEAQNGPWEEWAQQILGTLVRYGFEPDDEIDLPQAMADWFSDFDPVAQARAAKAEAELATCREAIDAVVNNWNVDGGVFQEDIDLLIRATETAG